MVTETDRYTSTDYTIMRRRQGRVDIDETERSYLKSSYYNQIVYKAWRKRETLRRNSSDIIYENEYKETRKDSMTQTMDRIEDINNNNNNQRKDVNYSQILNNKKKRSYMTRKHFSDDVIYVEIDDASDSRSECDSSDSVESVNIRLKRPVATIEDEQRLSRSDSNLNLPSEGMYSRKLVNNKNHLDITKTHMFKEIYADNLRQYSFLLAKVNLIFFDIPTNSGLLAIFGIFPMYSCVNVTELLESGHFVISCGQWKLFKVNGRHNFEESFFVYFL